MHGSRVGSITGHDLMGFTGHNWRNMTKQSSVAAIYIGTKDACFTEGRLIMHQKSPKKLILMVENFFRLDQYIDLTYLKFLADAFGSVARTLVLIYK